MVSDHETSTECALGVNLEFNIHEITVGSLISKTGSLAF